MASKQLTARVRLNTTQAETSINRLIGRINQLNRVANGATTSGIANGVNRASVATREWDSQLKNVNARLNAHKSGLGHIYKRLLLIAGVYAGIAGTKLMIDSSDAITSAENKLNYVTAKQLDAKYGVGTNADGSYTTDTLGTTQHTMDKMYASSQRVRMGYDDMMTNVSKSMALAGDAFDNNINKAIRFQEIMSEAYAVGGASAQEMSSSMYQMIQALGAGVLAGDELRSVREGAPLAYQAIEEFAQGVYNTTDSLKDMASQGKITSDMVVAAVMNAGNEMDSAFAQTEQTFAQTWTQIKNVAFRAFMPVAKMMRTALNNAIDNGLIQKAETLFTNIGKGILITFAIIKNAIGWIADNWDWLKHIVVGALILMITFMLIKAGVAVVCAYKEFKAWVIANSAMLATLVTIAIIIIAILVIIYVFYLWKQGAIDTGELILTVLAIIAIGLLLIGIITKSMIITIIAMVLFAVLMITTSCYNLCDFIIGLAIAITIAIVAFLAFVLVTYIATGTVMISIPLLIALIVIAVLMVLLAVFLKFTGQIVGFICGIWYAVQAICEWISIAWQNMCNSMGAWFWNAIADMLEGCEWLLKGINKIREALGKDAISIEGVRAKADSYASKKGQELPSISDAFDTGYSKGFDVGEGIQDKINGFGDKIKNLGSQYQNIDDKAKDKTSTLDSLGEKLGLDFNGFSFPALTDPNLDVSNLLGDNGGLGGLGDLGKLGKNVAKTADNTGKIADELDLTKEDLEYLRKVAEMEWKKEYTTANISLDMTNYNTVNGENDLDGIVNKLAEKLYEEMNVVANGVYDY